MSSKPLVNASLLVNPTTEPVVQTPDGRPPLVVHNVVAVADVNCALDLIEVSCRLRNCEYNPNRFPACSLRIWDPRVTTLIYGSGKIVVCGAKTELLSKRGASKVIAILRRIGYEQATLHSFRVTNMLAVCDLKFPLQIDDFVMEHSQYVTYEPEIFPAVIYRMMKPKLVMLIFVNGKIVVMGAKFRKELEEAMDQMYPVFRRHKK